MRVDRRQFPAGITLGSGAAAAGAASGLALGKSQVGNGQMLAQAILTDSSTTGLPQGIVVPDLVYDGETDNYAAIHDAMTSFGQNGGVVWLGTGSGGTIAVGTKLIPPAGVTLMGVGQFSQDSAATPTDIYTTIVPTSSFNPSHPLVELSNSQSGLQNLAVDAMQTAAYAVYINAPDCLLNEVTAVNGTSCSVASTSNADRCSMTRCVTGQDKAYSAGSLSVAALDWLINACRLGRGTKSFSEGGGLVENCHLTGGSPIISVSGGHTLFVGCYFDSPNGTAAFVHEGGSFTVVGGYVENNGEYEVPFIHEETESSPVLLSGVRFVTGKTRFSHLIDNPNAYTTVDDVTIDVDALAGSAGIASLWESGAPAISRGIIYGGSLQGAPQSSFLNADTPAIAAAMPTYTGCSLSLTPGTWLVNGQANCWPKYASALTEVAIWLSTAEGSGGNIYGAAEGSVPADADIAVSLAFSCIVTVTSMSTVYLNVEFLNSNSGCCQASGDYGDDNLTGITAVKLA